MFGLSGDGPGNFTWFPEPNERTSKPFFLKQKIVTDRIDNAVTDVLFDWALDGLSEWSNKWIISIINVISKIIDGLRNDFTTRWSVQNDWLNQQKNI